jgi:3-dehydroshikimate dehydratase
VGVAVRPGTSPTRVRLTRNRIHDNGQPIARCQAGGSCDPALRKGGIVLGVPGLEHEGFVGSRGGGVHPDPATLQRICPSGAPDCQPMPNDGITPPTIASVRRAGRQIVVQGRLTGRPDSHYVVEVFGNARANGAEGEVVLGMGAADTDAAGAGQFTVTIDAPGAAPGSVTATVTSPEGATSAFSAGVAPS